MLKSVYHRSDLANKKICHIHFSNLNKINAQNVPEVVFILNLLCCWVNIICG